MRKKGRLDSYGRRRLAETMCKTPAEIGEEGKEGRGAREGQLLASSSVRSRGNGRRQLQLTR
jgi:hypothetical protein